MVRLHNILKPSVEAEAALNLERSVQLDLKQAASHFFALQSRYNRGYHDVFVAVHTVLQLHAILA